MKISKIEFENFRNFKDHGEIRCSTDGKVTIIYGKNGDGKTTLHQLFQWIFYGQVHFNRTTTDRLYNLQYESECSFGDTFQVMGCIDFEHDGIQYSLHRTYTYRKGLNDSEKIAEDFSLNKMDEDFNWKRMDRPKETIEKLLPSGLSEYFFFDGESMIADLRVKGRDSAGKLRKALYSMFDLDVLEAAINHVGETKLKTTVLGKLYLSKGTISSGSQISKIRTNIEGAQTRLESLSRDLDKAQEKKAEDQKILKSVSEQIGSVKSKADYERQRKVLKSQRDSFLKNATDIQAEFGDHVSEMFPRLLISKAVQDAKQKIHLKVEQSKLPSGISKKLISYLTDPATHQCICGNPLCDAERDHIRAYLEMMPPRSYASMYQDFSKTARIWGRGYDERKIEDCIMRVLENNEQASNCDAQIQKLDADEKKSPDIEDLIVTRQWAEQEISELDARISKTSTEQKKLEIYLKKQMQDFDKATQENAASEKITRKIRIMEEVAACFRKKLNDESSEYSHRLEDNIQSLIDNMLTSRRKVTVSPEFAVRVTDSFNDESKSEGQFAAVSFAYIGGILKMLQSEEHLSSKEYPLVLDGPFSKLDPEHRQNVINMIPQFAPQVILFSKDDLHEVFPSESIGRVWTIVSNEEKNVARIEEGVFMELTADVSLKGTAWNRAIDNLAPIFKTRTNYSIYMLALTIGVMYDHRVERPEENGEEIRSVPRNVLQNNDNGKLDFIFQAAILSTTTEELSEEERLELAFGEKSDFRKIDFLTQFANFGITKLVDLLGDSTVETMDNIKNFLVSTVEGKNLDIDALPDDLLLDEDL